MGGLFLALFLASAGCQLVDQAAEIPTILTAPATPPRTYRPLWSDVALTSGPSVTKHDGSILALHVVGSPPQKIISFGADRWIIVWDLVSGVGRRVRQSKGTARPTLATFGTRYGVLAYIDGADLVVECVADCAHLWSQKRLRTRGKSLAFHADDSAVLMGGVDGKITRWRYLREAQDISPDERDRCLELYAGHQTVVSSVASHPFNRAFFSGDWVGSLYAWLPYDSDDFKGEFDRNLFTGHFYAAPGTFTKGLRTADRGINDISFSADGTRMALGTENGFVEVWEVKGFELQAKKEEHTGRVLATAFSPSARRLASVGRDGQVIIFEVADEPDFGVAPTATRQRLVPVAKYNVEDALHLRYITENTLVVATATGLLVELDSTGVAVAPTPIPTPVATDRKPIDSDY
jgi:WD40 repeat protein